MLPHRLPERGPILHYLTFLMEQKRKEADDAHAAALAAVRDTFNTDAGRMVLKLLEVSLASGPMPAATDVRALGERNAQWFILSDLRRLLTDEPEQMAQRKADARGSQRGDARG